MERMNIAAPVENPPFEDRKGWGSLLKKVGQPAKKLSLN